MLFLLLLIHVVLYVISAQLFLKDELSCSLEHGFPRPKYFPYLFSLLSVQLYDAVDAHLQCRNKKHTQKKNKIKKILVKSAHKGYFCTGLANLRMINL